MSILSKLAKRFVAGENVDEAIVAVKKLNNAGMIATMDYLGENVHNREEATKAADEYLVLLDKIKESGIDSNVSMKLSMMGLEIDFDFCIENVARVIKKANDYGNFVRIDMEGSELTEMTLQAFYSLQTSYDNVGVVVQSYLFRTENDISSLIAKQANIRLCKGAYKEPPKIAFTSKKDVNENYLKLAKRYLTDGKYMGIATHDAAIIKQLAEYIRDNSISKEKYEWQMLFGISRKHQEELVQKGEKIRVYVPYGNDWLGYFKRRLMERKENVFFAIRHFFTG